LRGSSSEYLDASGLAPGEVVENYHPTPLESPDIPAEDVLYFLGSRGIRNV
jgi:hypothetical protein